MNLRAGLDDVKQRKFLTIAGLELRPLGRPARNQSLYVLRYLGSNPLELNKHNVLVVVLVMLGAECYESYECKDVGLLCVPYESIFTSIVFVGKLPL
jgi:hypothetical protein